MKKLKKFSLILLIISSVAFVGFVVYDKIQADTKPPVVTYPEETIECSVKVTEAELLQGVKAKDDRSGDVSDSLVVEKMSGMMDDGTRVITYAAIDEQGNVGRAKRELKYTDYQKPRFSMSAPLRFEEKDMDVDFLKNVHVESSLDGDLSEKVKLSIPGGAYIYGAGSYPVELHVTDSAGNTTVIPTIVDIYSRKEENIELELKEYLVYKKVNENFNPQEYLEDNGYGNVKINSEVNIQTPGVYQVEYVVTSGQSMGRTRLIVVVE